MRIGKATIMAVTLMRRQCLFKNPLSLNVTYLLAAGLYFGAISPGLPTSILGASCFVFSARVCCAPEPGPPREESSFTAKALSALGEMYGLAGSLDAPSGLSDFVDIYATRCSIGELAS